MIGSEVMLDSVSRVKDRGVHEHVHSCRAYRVSLQTIAAEDGDFGILVPVGDYVCASHATENEESKHRDRYPAPPSCTDPCKNRVHKLSPLNVCLCFSKACFQGARTKSGRSPNTQCLCGQQPQSSSSSSGVRRKAWVWPLMRPFPSISPTSLMPFPPTRVQPASARITSFRSVTLALLKVYPDAA